MPRNATYAQALIQIAIQDQLGTQKPLTEADVLLVENFKEQIKAMEEDQLAIVSDDPFYKPVKQYNKHNNFGFDVPWIYSGAAGTPSVLETIFRICGFNSTITAGEKVVYTRGGLASLDAATLKMSADMDGQDTYEYGGFNGRGQVGCNWEAGKIPRFNVTNLLTSYLEPKSGTLVTPDWGVQKTNIGECWEGDVAYVGKLIVDGVDKPLCLEAMSNDNLSGVSIGLTATAGCSANGVPEASNADSTFTVKYKLPDFTTEFNPWALDDSTLALEFGCGSEAGKRIRIACPSVEVTGETTREAGNNNTTYISQTFRCLTGSEITEE